MAAGPNPLTSVSIRPKCVYGLRTDVKGNIHFTSHNEVIYPVEGVLCFHDYVRNKQRFLRLPEDSLPEIIAMSHQRKLLAVLETNPREGRIICIYELSTLKRRRTLELPEAASTAEIAQIAFSHDARSLIILTKPPNELIFFQTMDKTCTLYMGRPTNPTARATATCFAANSQDSNMCAVCGENVLILMNKAEKGLVVSSVVQCNFEATSMGWLQNDLLMVGTSENEIILVENGDLKYRQIANEAESMDILWDQDALNRELEQKPPDVTEKLVNTRVVCMIGFPRGFAFAIFNQVYVFERINKFKFERKTILKIPIGFYPSELYQITNLAIDSKQDTVIVTTKHSQIYVGVLIVPETLKVKHLDFEPLGLLLHIGDIVHISLCAWKPILMTASSDQTVRIWNYETEKIELVRKFQVEVNIVELNTTGLMAAIGFSDQVRVTQIFMDELNIVKTYNFPRCKDIKYSNLGHLMAAAYDNLIAITSVYKLDLLRTLKGHNGMVLSVCFNHNDKYLISGGAEGAIYVWEVDTGNRVQEIVQKGTEYRSVCVTSGDPFSIFAATKCGVLREFKNAELFREIAPPSKTKIPPALVDMCLARSDQVMFASNDCGNLFNVRLDAGGTGCSNFRFFTNTINKVRFTYDGTLLVTISKNGTMAIWVLDNIEGKVARMDPDLLRSQEVLIPRAVLEEKNDQIGNLEIRLKQQAEEFEYQLTQNEIFDGQQLAEVHKRYCNALEELKNKNTEIEERHAEEMNQLAFQMNDVKEEHRKQLDDLANQYAERMLIEYHKFVNLRDSMLQLRENYEGKLKTSAGILQDTVEGLEGDYKKQLDERKELIRELMKDMQDKKIEFFSYCRQVEVENDRNMVDTQIDYENKLTTERSETQLWRGRAGVLQTKYDNLTKDIEHLDEELEALRGEHNKSQRNISKLMNDIEDLQKEVGDRDYAIQTKENRIQDLLHKNQELDKYKQVLAQKIAELAAQIEPREFQINDKRKHILEMENELAGLNQNNSQMELQLKELTQKYFSNVAELKLERHRARAGRECISSIRSEIYYLGGQINFPEKLKLAVKDLFLKHTSDDELRRHISMNAEVRDEFQRQRAQIERVLEKYRTRSDAGDEKRKYAKLFKENVILLEEIEKVRGENKTLWAKIKIDIRNERKAQKN